MKRFIMTLLILGAVVGVVAMIMKRRGSSMDDWRSFAEDSWSQTKDAAEGAADQAKGALDDAADQAKDIAS